MDIDDLDATEYVRRTLELARTAGDRGDDPYGSLLVHDGTVLAEETNRERTEEDLALHPELTLARRADRRYDARTVAETVLVTSTEPCAMCAAGIAYAGLGGVVYSVAGATAAAAFDAAPGIPCGEVFDRLGADVPVRGPVLEDEGMAVHEAYRGR
jgi:tRNA(Arg) A34 adenosine deaminase TadA